jgi:hypothetical protein
VLEKHIGLNFILYVNGHSIPKEQVSNDILLYYTFGPRTLLFCTHHKYDVGDYDIILEVTDLHGLIYQYRQLIHLVPSY